jgi:prepilin-type N-terminal cleavage/methylation domain-containing protein
MRGFTLLEVMVVLAIVGVLSASAVPSIVDMVKKADGEQAIVEATTSLAAARDSARNRAMCLDYVQTPATPNSGPYTLKVFDVACPGESARERRFVFERAVSPTITSLVMTPMTPAAVPVDTIHFDRNGALYAPIARMRIDVVVNGSPRAYSIYPAAGTISFDEIR